MIKNVLSALTLMIGLNAYATKHEVTILADAGPGSLRDQIANAGSGDTIVFNVALIGNTITLTTGEIAFSKALVIEGPGANDLTISGNESSRIFLSDGGDLSISGLTLTKGKLAGTFGYDGGALKHITLGNLHLKDVRFVENDSRQSNGSQGGAVYFGVSGGNALYDSCFFGDNTGDDYGGAISNNGGPEKVTIKSCWFNSNSASGPAGALYSNADTLIIESTTFSNNFASNRASIWLSVSDTKALTHISNSTFSYNYATFPNEIFGMEAGKMVLINNTFNHDNEPITIGDSHESDTFYFIAHNNIFNIDGPDINGEGDAMKYTSLGGNVCSDTSLRFFLNSTNDTNQVDPKLSTLQGNFALAQGHPILPGSPAIKNGTTGGPSSDQWGRMRSYLDAGAIDYICNASQGTDVISACVSYTWIDGNTYTANNNTATYLIIDGASFGCDSIVSLDLTINALPDNSTTRNGRTLTATSTTASYVWLDCDDNMNPIGNETMQSFTTSQSGTYAVEVTENGCKDTSSCINIDLTSIADNSFAAGIQVYPNPSTGIVNLEFAKLQGHLTIELRSVTGQSLAKYEINQNNVLQIELNQKAGIYFLVMNNDQGEQAIIKLIKE